MSENNDIKGKLLLVFVVITGFSLLLAFSILMYANIENDKLKMLEGLSAVAEVVAGESVAALSFEDAETAQNNLSSLKYYKSIDYACILTKEKGVFSEYKIDNKVEYSCGDYAEGYKYEVTAEKINIYKPIRFSGKTIGLLKIKASLHELTEKNIESVKFLILLFLIVMFVVTVVSRKVMAHIINPITELRSTAQRITQSNDHSLRMEKTSNDEVGGLVDAFNKMLDQVEESDVEIIKEKENAKSRAIELDRVNSEMEVEIKERIKAEYELQDLNDTLEEKVNERTAELKELNHKIGGIARSAGMAEMASGVLHNVGNVLNSVNVSASVIREMLRKTKASKLSRVVSMLEENENNISEFISSDSRGAQIPKFLSLLSTQLEEEKQGMFGELDSLSENIDHIKNVIGMQQSYASNYGVSERVTLSDLIEDSIRLNMQSIGKDVEIVKNYNSIPQLNIDKHKVLQVIINLISNAKNALVGIEGVDKKMIININEKNGFSILEIKDTGVGIAADDLEHLFEYGFKKRRTGHGFGLHHSLMIVKELGGELSVQSDGLGKGASFILQLPFDSRGDA